MAWVQLHEDIAELFEEAQILPPPRRARISIPIWEPFWTFPKLEPPNDPALLCECGYHAHTRQQLRSHRYWHKKRANSASSLELRCA